MFVSNAAFSESTSNKDKNLSISKEIAPAVETNALSGQIANDKKNKNSAAGASPFKNMENSGYECNEKISRSGLDGSVGKNSECTKTKTVFEVGKDKK